MKTVVIVNPRAGLAAARARDAVDRHPAWKTAEVRLTREAGDARTLAAEAAASGAEVVIAAGGDGTANEVAWGLLGTETVFGLLPMGSGNGLARTLGIPLRPYDALDTLAGAEPRWMDVGMANGRPFLNVAGAGFDARVGADFHAHGSAGGRRGVFTYVRLSLLRSLHYQAEAFQLSAGERSFEGRALVVAFVNGRQYGGGATIAPGARLDDGLLDIVVIEDAPRFEIAWNASRMFLGGIERFRRYRHIPAAAAILTGTGPVLHHRDGEPEEGAERLEVGIQPRALRVLVPQRTLADPRGPFGTAG